MKIKKLRAKIKQAITAGVNADTLTDYFNEEELLFILSPRGKTLFDEYRRQLVGEPPPIDPADLGEQIIGTLFEFPNAKDRQSFIKAMKRADPSLRFETDIGAIEIEGKAVEVNSPFPLMIGFKNKQQQKDFLDAWQDSGIGGIKEGATSLVSPEFVRPGFAKAVLLAKENKAAIGIKGTHELGDTDDQILWAVLFALERDVPIVCASVRGDAIIQRIVDEGAAKGKIPAALLEKLAAE